MARMTSRAHPVTPPQRPYFASLKCAVKMLIAHGNRPGDLDLARVAATYCCDISDVTDEFDRQLTKVSLVPSNSFEVREGK